jgi:ribosomal protein L11 methyltransferase
MRVLQIATGVADAELAADRLWQAGARAVEEIDLADGRVGARSVLAADDVVSLDRLGPMPAAWTVEWIDVPDEPSDAWRELAVPIPVGDRLVLRPAWLPELADGRLEIAIEPGGSFGLGDHPTTRLSAEAVVRLTTPGCTVLDVGCGSGVLAIIAVRLGAARAVAIDVAHAAVEATYDNASRNGVDDRVSASSTLISEVTGPYDLVVANVLAPTIVGMADDLRRLVGAGGSLVVSGILAEAHEHVLDALAPLVPVRTDVMDAWAAVELRG